MEEKQSNQKKRYSGNKTLPLSSIIGYFILAIGAIVSALSLDYNSSVLAVIGTTLVFWGALLMYFKRKNPLLENALAESLIPYYNNATILGKDIYYYSPPNIFGLENTLVLNHNSLSKEKIEEINSFFSVLKNDIAVMPPGQGLSQLIEKNQDIRFSSLNISDIKTPFENALMDEFELVKSIQFSFEEQEIHIIVNGSIFNKLYEDKDEIENIVTLGDPVISSVACGLSRVTRKPIKIENLVYDRNPGNIKAVLKICEIPDLM